MRVFMGENCGESLFIGHREKGNANGQKQPATKKSKKRTLFPHACI